jgi:hypothetical protein
MEHNHNESHHENHKHHGAISKLKGHASALETWLIPIFAGLPHLPQNWRSVITKIAPWLSLVFGILALIGLLGTGMLGVILSPLLALSAGMSGIGIFITILLGLITSVLSILSFRPLQAMKKTGWDYCFYAFTISALSTIVSILLMPMHGGFGDVVAILIGAYILFEVRERYN